MKKTPLTQTFNETATEAYQAFPQQLKRLVVLLAPSSDTPVYVSPAIAAQLTKSTADVKAAIKERTKWMQDNFAVGEAGENYNLAGTVVSLIALNQNITGNFSRRYTKKMNLLFNLDHEIGHKILKNGHPSAEISLQQAESAADAFAMLRHIQRFGKKTDHAGSEGEEVALGIVAGEDAEHYTTGAIEKIIRISEERDISSLSLRETAKLAEKTAGECHLDDKTLEKIRIAFLPVQALYKAQNTDGQHLCRKILSVMKKYRHDPDIFKAGQQSLHSPLAKKFMTEAAKADPYWNDALDFINGAAPLTRKAATPKSLRGSR